LSAAASYAPRGIRVNGVASGMVRTQLTERLTSSEPALKASTAMHALGRIGEPSDIASAIAWLLDPKQSWVTGQVLSVDGGMSAVKPRIGA
jgi:NAD(P)-dependent dehydrogenase (short-subunit alcohol dehydrogenase family)